LLKPITTSPYPFHTLTIDFILSLPPSRRFAHGDELFDTAMTVTDKFTKAVKIVPGKGTYAAPDWATRFWQSVYPDWGLPNAIISDRDAKFVSEFWKSLFQKSGTRILTSTAYHPQTDGQSERSNQTIEIALRYYVSERQDNWADCIDIVQAAIMTSLSATTTKTPSELIYGLNIRQAIDLSNPAAPTSADDWADVRENHRRDATDAIAYAQEIMKLSTDKKRSEFSLAVGDMAYLRLHKGYHLPGIPKAKLGQQRVGPFEVLAIVGSNAYKLKLPESWKIWPVISSVYLDHAPAGEDPYQRLETPTPEVTEGDLPTEDKWEVAAVVKKRTTRRKVQYLVRWKNFGPEDDTWMGIDELSDCADLVKEYETATGNVDWEPPEAWLA
jgi:hypothetical protein